jgi:lantibiotic modifying enzyme
LGGIEFLDAAGRFLQQDKLCSLASEKLATLLTSAAVAGDYHWNSGARRFNLGLFRGLAGVGYTCLRRAVPALPNVLLWE